MTADDPDYEPPTEPLESLFPEKKTPDAAVTPAATPRRYRFTAGVPASETATIRDDANTPLYTYRGFASVVGIVAALMSGIVIVAGGAAVLFLIAERRPLPAIFALILSVAFAALIALLMPRITVTLFDRGSAPALTLTTVSRFTFPTATYAIGSPQQATLAHVRKSFLSRLGRNRWRIVQDGRVVGQAIEESLGRALQRKLLGKFNRKYEANVRLEYHGLDVGSIVRRGTRGEIDVLDIHGDTDLDPRVLVGLATLILGSEP